MKRNNRGFGLVLLLVALLLVALLALLSVRSLNVAGTSGEAVSSAQISPTVEQAQKAVDEINQKIEAIQEN